MKETREGDMKETWRKPEMETWRRHEGDIQHKEWDGMLESFSHKKEPAHYMKITMLCINTEKSKPRVEKGWKTQKNKYLE